jgi:hypothetical protein
MSKRGGEDNINRVFSAADSGQGLVAGFCEHSNGV